MRSLNNVAIAKPDCTGQRFGSLTVLSKTDRFIEYGRNKKHHRLWRLQCDCGQIVEMTRSQFDTKRSPKLCCGCQVRSRRLDRAIKATEDLTGQIFGFLTVIGSTYGDLDAGRRLWILKCQCGKIIERRKYMLTRAKGGQKSCGCLHHDYKRGGKACDLTGQRFGLLTVMSRSDERLYNRPMWLMQCDCGKMTKMTVSRIRNRVKTGCRLNCGDRIAHPEIGHQYPATPNPYPREAGDLLTKYLNYTKTRCRRVRAEILDERMDRLIRACWILTYRRQQGEDLSELYERRYIFKYLRYATVRVLHKDYQMRYPERVNRLESPQKINAIGRAMFNQGLPNYPVSESETPEKNITSLGRQAVKRIKFRRR